MDMTGEHRIDAPRDAVWQALTDAVVPRACIPGRTELEKTSETRLSAAIVQRIGPARATFAGEVELPNMNAPDSDTVHREGKGGVAGLAKGRAQSFGSLRAHLNETREGSGA